MSDLQINKKPRLGRGLGSLLGAESASNIQTTQRTAVNNQINHVTHLDSATAAAPAGKVESSEKAPIIVNSKVDPLMRIWNVAIDKLSASEYQPRQHFDKDKINELANSIKEHGILQPITVRKKDNGTFEIIAGERRWRAAQAAGLHEVPVIIKELSNQKSLELAIIENIQREDLNIIEEAEAYEKLIRDYGLTQQQAADKVGKDRATVANALRILMLPQKIKTYLLDGKISNGHAKVLLSEVDEVKQLELSELIVKDKLSVRALEKLITKNKNKQTNITNDNSFDENVKNRLVSGLADELQKIIGTKVSIDYNKGKGKLNIHFYSDEELTNIIDRIKG